AVGCNLPSAPFRSGAGTDRPADARPEEPQVVVDLRRSPDRRAARPGRVALLNRDGWRDALDTIDVRLLHSIEELLRVCRERLDVAPLSLRIDRVEREGRLPGAGRARDGYEGPTRNIEIEVLEVVLTSPADDDQVF